MQQYQQRLCRAQKEACFWQGDVTGLLCVKALRTSFCRKPNNTRLPYTGARLTAYELMHDGLPATLICDSAAAALMAQGKVDAIVVGADRVAANGDTANKIGTYSLAVLAKHHK